jgi:hypothetical protein
VQRATSLLAARRRRDDDDDYDFDVKKRRSATRDVRTNAKEDAFAFYARS